MAATLENILATTFQKSSKTISDSIIGSIWLYNELNKKGRVVTVDSGKTLDEPLSYAMSPGGFYDDSDITSLTSLTTTGVKQLGAASYAWSQLYAMVTISGLERLTNRGTSQIVDLVKGKIDQTKRTLKRKLHDALYTTTTNGITSLRQIAPSSTVSGTYGSLGGLDGDTYSWWRAQGVEGKSDLSELLANLATLTRKIKLAEGRPRIVVMHTDVYAKYESLAGNVIAYPRAGQTIGDLSFAELTYKGVPIVYNDDVTDGTHKLCYMIDTDYLRLKVHQDRNVKMEKFETTPGTDASYAKVFWMGNLVCSKRNAQGVIVFSGS